MVAMGNAATAAIDAAPISTARRVGLMSGMVLLPRGCDEALRKKCGHVRPLCLRTAFCPGSVGSVPAICAAHVAALLAFCGKLSRVPASNGGQHAQHRSLGNRAVRRSDLIGQRAANYLMQRGVDPAHLGAVAAIIPAARLRATLVSSPSASHLTSFPLDA